MRRVVPLIAVLSLGFAPAPFPKPDVAKEDLKKMQGEWVRVSMTIDGKRVVEKAGSAVAAIKGDKLEFSSIDAWMFTLDATKNPKWISARHAKSALEPVGLVGVYRLEGDTLLISTRWCDSDCDRPVNFDPQQHQVWVHVYKRKKP